MKIGYHSEKQHFRLIATAYIGCEYSFIIRQQAIGQDDTVRIVSFKTNDVHFSVHFDGLSA
jgi:hypothetical protein